VKRPPGISSTKTANRALSWRYRFKHGKKADGGDNYITKAGFATMREAVEAMAREKAKLGKAPRRGAGDVTLGQFLFEWLDYAGAEWSPLTRQVNRFHAERIISRIGHLPLSKITLEILDREKQYLLAHGKKVKTGTAPLSPKSVKETMTLVKAALHQAKKWNRISVNPAADLEVPTIPRRQTAILQPAELAKLLQMLAGKREYAMVLFAAASGCRRGEMFALQVSDVDLTSGKVIINKSLEETRNGIRVKSTKSGKARSLTLPQFVLPALREHLAMIAHERELFGQDYEDHQLLFPKPNGQHYRPNKIGSRLNYLLKQAGINSTLHGLRHFNASWLLSKSSPLPDVSRRLGHANSAITLAIYAHAMEGDDAAAAQTMEEGLANLLPEAKRSLKPVLVTPSDTDSSKTGTEN
jgi:integrase